DGVTVTWASNNEAVISPSGTVTRKTDDVPVTLTATLKKGSGKTTKQFTLTVLQSDQGFVEKAAEKLKIGYTSGDSENSVTKNLTLPKTVTGFDGVTVTWQSGNETVISTNGTVTRPNDKNIEVTLTATLEKGSGKTTKQFTLTVKQLISATTDAEKVAAAKESLQIGFAAGDSVQHVTKNLTLPDSAPYYPEIGVTWVSNMQDVIANNGTVTRQDDDVQVMLTATLKKGSETASVPFTVTVLGTAQELLNTALQQFAPAWHNTEVTGSIELAQTLPNLSGSQLTWTASNDAVAVNHATGTVIPDLVDTEVTLTARAEYRGKTAEKNFPCRVKRLLKVTSKDKWEGGKDSHSTCDFTQEGELHTMHIVYNTDGSESRRIEAKYKLELDAAKKQVTAVKTKVRVSFNGDVWLTPQEACEKNKEQYRRMFTALLGPAFQALEAAEQPSWEAFKRYFRTYLSMMPPGGGPGIPAEDDNEGLFNLSKSGGWFSYFEKTDTWDAFRKLSPEAQGAKIKKGLQRVKNGFYTELNIPEQTPINDALQTIIDSYIQYLDMELQDELTPVRYSYAVRAESWAERYPQGYWIEAYTFYDSTKAWYAQQGYYEQKNSDWTQIALYGNMAADSQEGVINIVKDGHRKIYSGRFTQNSFTGINVGDSADTVTIPITDKGNGIIELTYKGAIYRLTYVRKHILEN
ncbi:MAG: hypothetical protein P1P65_07030, partial [Treponema sp.]